MKKIVHIINSMDLGGNERLLETILDKIDKSAFVNTVVFLDRGQDKSSYLRDSAKNKGAECHTIPMRGNFDVSAFKRLINTIKKISPDIVHTHLVLSQVYGRLAAKFAGVKKIISSEQNIYSYKSRVPFRFLEKYLAGFTTRIVACSCGVKDYLINRVGINKDKVIVIYNCIDETLLGREPAPAAVEKNEIPGNPGGKLIVGSLGHLHKQKGYDCLIDAVKVITAAVPGIIFLIGGTGPLKDHLEAKIKAGGMTNHIRLTGFVKDSAAFMDMLDIFVMPSLWEGFGISALEAIAAGKPVVVSDVAGLNEIIENNESGLFAEPGNHLDLAEKLSVLALDGEKRRYLAENARKRAKDFSCGKIIPLFEKLYNDN
ncbi:glycosyltransferase [bacterium]|jgi:glycosyltransferase involved in cell wall biosynthesis|nr:glycosyltransferase [bacterium]